MTTDPAILVSVLTLVLGGGGIFGFAKWQMTKLGTMQKDGFDRIEKLQGEFLTYSKTKNDHNERIAKDFREGQERIIMKFDERLDKVDETLRMFVGNQRVSRKRSRSV